MFLIVVFPLSVRPFTNTGECTPRTGGSLLPGPLFLPGLTVALGESFRLSAFLDPFACVARDLIRSTGNYKYSHAQFCIPVLSESPWPAFP